MRLKHLSLHGFKTFAPKTDLSFGEGLTAIVGPNGSGKSNVADAVRWVLGEQSLLNLRAKKTEDLIFAGSSNRAPLGMAEVSLTLDNSDRLLPLEFAEVTLTRRAFRSGENEYYLNKSRVRLRDIQEIAAALGEAYTVVGQGLVDAALSLKPEERRELFEEAAEIRGYFMQREEALRRLTRTEENTTRISDLLIELEPQMRRMERQAHQAEEYGKLRAELLLLLKEWYGGRWAAALRELREAEKGEEEAEREVSQLKEAVAAANVALGEARGRASEGRETLANLQQERAAATQRHAAANGERAVLEERIASISERRSALLAEIAEQEKSRAALVELVRALRAEREDHSAEIAALEESERDIASRLAKLDKEWAEANRRLEAAQGERDRLERTLVSIESRIADAERRRTEGESAVREAKGMALDARARLDTASALLAQLSDKLGRRCEAAQAAIHEQKEAEEVLVKARATHAAAEGQLRELTRRDDALHSQEARMDAERQASLYVGVRAVMSAAHAGKLDGVRGTVAELVRVPARLETAIEAALGGRLQEVVVGGWSDAERAIAYLKGGGAGRATFLPLDTLRVSSIPTPPSGGGIVGVASQLVEYDPALAILAQAVLGRLLIVESLPAARRVIQSLPSNSPWTLATLEGEVVRPGGSVTGGSNTRPSDKGSRSLLSRERERRELTATRAELQVQIADGERALKVAEKGVSEREKVLGEKVAAANATREGEVVARAAHLEGEAALGRSKKELAWREGLLASAKADMVSVNSLYEKLKEEKGRAEAAVAPAIEVVEKASEMVAQVGKKRETLLVATSESRTRLAVLAEAARNSEARRREGEARLDAVEGRIGEIESRLGEAEREGESAAAQHGLALEKIGRLSNLISSLEASLTPAEHQAQEREAAVAEAESALSGASGALLEAETRHTRASVRREHCAGALDTLWVEIVEELHAASDDRHWRMNGEGVTSSVDSDLPDWRDAPGGPSDALSLLGIKDAKGQNAVDPEDTKFKIKNAKIGVQNSEPAEGTERRVHALRARLARTGPINPLAGEEHRALLERHDYLQGQLADLLGAAEHLKRIISELDRAMSERFAVTFEQVNEAFGHFFSTLFGGGSARLELTDPHDISQTGIEISAQPPGKRMQPLAALSGGERALTSAALLFALLKVRPVPFCVLDEVDAALDESNVVRFRDALQELGVKTQFVVVTHNRGTIEAADILYGVSMAGDGTSKLLSLKVG